MQRIKHFVRIALASVACALPVSATALPDHYDITYSVTRLGVEIGKSNSQLHIDDAGNYRYELDTKPVGFAALFVKDHVTEVSSGKILADKIIPSSYRYHRSGGKRSKEESADFNWNEMVVDTRERETKKTLPIEPNTQDKLSFQLALMSDLAKQNTSLAYTLADGTELKQYEFEIMGEEALRTAVGTLATIKIKKHSKGSNRTTIIWMGKDVFFVPLRIVQYKDKDETFNMIVESISGIPVPAKPKPSAAELVGLE